MGWQVINWIQNKEDHFLAQGFQHNPDFDSDACYKKVLCGFLIGMSIHLNKYFSGQQWHICYDANMDQDSPFHMTSRISCGTDSEQVLG